MMAGFMYLTSAAVYAVALLWGQFFVGITSPKINSVSQIEKIIEEEKKKLDIKPVLGIIVKLTESEKGEATPNCINWKEQYVITIGGSFQNESVLRHELYHIFDGHLGKCPEKKQFTYPYYFFWAEPRATFYQVTGLKPFNLFKKD